MDKNTCEKINIVLKQTKDKTNARNLRFSGGAVLYRAVFFDIIKRKNGGTGICSGVPWNVDVAFALKYGTWKIGQPDAAAVAALERGGYGALTARVLSARGCETAEQAEALLRTDSPLEEPLLLREMDRAVAAIEQALRDGTRIAVFGDYDVDGITATCLLTDYLRSRGADCIYHIPGRLEEGYGLNAGAIRELAAQGVGLIVSVDCGITALEEAQLCRELGVRLVITDHHECKPTLPQADAVVDPHRPDRTYPHTDLSGVGVAFKLAAALEGDQDAAARRYCDLVCLGTVADVMPLRGENRRLVVMGLADLQRPHRLGLRALIEACSCSGQPITAGTIGYVLAPRINAAGRMEHAELAVQLFLSDDPAQAQELAETLCRLNRERQSTESEIYREASDMVRREHPDDSAIVLAGENWHQGVIGIVASRLCEEFCRPTFLICMNGEHGKASSRSYGGFNLFRSLQELAPLLEGYGGHEFAAGFTIPRENIDVFRQEMCRRAQAHRESGAGQPALEIDCAVQARLLTEPEVAALDRLEPCGAGCPKPVLCLSGAGIERVSTVGGGKHLRLQLRSADGVSLQAIYFSAGALAQRLHPGDRVDVAFHAQINEFRNVRSVQLNVLDLRRYAPAGLFDRYREGERLTGAERAALAPQRSDVADVWRYLCRAADRSRTLHCERSALCLAVSTASPRHSPERTLPCVAILAELHLLTVRRDGAMLTLTLADGSVRAALENSALYRALKGES